MSLLAMICLAAQIGLTPLALMCQDVLLQVMNFHPSRLQVPIGVSRISMTP